MDSDTGALMHPVDRLRESRILPVLLLLGAVAAFLFISLVSGILAPFLWAMITAYILFPIVAKLEQWLRLPRVVVVVGLYVVFIASITLLIIFLGPVVLDQGRGLINSLPDSVQNARNELIADETIRIGGIEFDTRDLNERIDEIVADFVGRFGERAVPLVLHTVELAVHILVYFLVTFYFLLHGDKILRQSRILSPRRYRATIDRVGKQVNATLGAYIRGQVILFAIMSVSTYVALRIYDVENALALAIATGILELIPIIGPWIAGTAAVTVALSQGHAPFGWTQVELAVVVAITYFVLRMLEDHFVIPQLIGRIVRVHPVLVIFAVLAGAQVFGMLGLLLAVPAVATIKIIIQAVYFELGNPLPRRVLAVKQPGDLEEVKGVLSTDRREHIVLLIGPGALGWDELPVLQQLAMLAVSQDTPIDVVTADSFAASLATAAGIKVITQAKLSDEAAMAETLIVGERDRREKQRFAFKPYDPAPAESIAPASPPAVEPSAND